MPASGSGWEFVVTRQSVQRRASDGKKRTVGQYQIFHDGVAQTGADLSGMIAESKGPGANKPANNGLRIEEGRYPVATHSGATKKKHNHPTYVTHGFNPDATPNGDRKPSLKFLDTDKRGGILLHPGVNFLSSIGCFNPCTSLPDEKEMITWSGSIRRVIAIIADLQAFSGAAFPNSNNVKVPKATFVVDGEP